MVAATSRNGYRARPFGVGRRDPLTIGTMQVRKGITLAAVALATTAGCSLLSPVAAPVVPTFPPTTTAAPTNSPDTKPVLPSSCKDLLDGQQLDKALGLPLSAVVKTVVGQPSPSVGQTGRVSCSYGIPSAASTYALELSLTSYRDVPSAAARVPVNVEALRIPGVEPVPVTAGGMTGMYLALPDGPVLIASAGIYSVTVSLGPTSFSPDAAIGSAAAVAGMVLTNVRA